MSKQRVLVTCALPYANGSLHIGHLVGYLQVDMYVRALRAMGTDAHYICANDAHGTPIELNAKKRGMTPEAMVAMVHEDQKGDFARFDVNFDVFSVTHSETNRDLVERAYAGLQARGLIEEREVDGNFCVNDGRFLPDRFIKGSCPKCRAADQYGDVCERCGATYAPTDLIEPFCALCHQTPEVRPSRHAFFKLSSPELQAFLRTWIDAGTLQADVANYVRSWLDGGLKDWCITRDGPYFGFPVPNMANKYFYVWLDAPFGYVSSSVEWGRTQGLSEDELWRSPNTRIEHVIGKDIMYFHTLFWPAVLKSLDYALPSKVHVHGMLTVNGEKMSKSRGTFVRAATLADHLDPQALRYYFATKNTPESRDLDLALDDLVHRVNAELVNKHANLFHRVGQFLTARLGGRLGALPFTAAQAQQAPDAAAAAVAAAQSSSMAQTLPLAQQVVAACRRIEGHFAARDIAQATRELAQVADIGNEFMQAMRPWDLIREDAEAARAVCTFVANVCQALCIYLYPIVPRLAEAAASGLGIDCTKMDAGSLFALTGRPVNVPPRLIERIERSRLDAMIDASREDMAPTQPAAPAAAPAQANAEPEAPARALEPPLRETIGIDTFAQIDLRVGIVRAAEAVPKSKKLLRLMVDCGEAQPRQILSGIAQQVAPEALVGRAVTVVANLAPAKLMGLMSHGMILAADGPDGALSLVAPGTPVPGGSPIR